MSEELEQRLAENAIRRDIRDMQKNIQCLKDSFEGFTGKYQPYLEKIMENHLYWNRVREDVIKGTAKSIIWSLIVGFVLAVWFAGKEYILQLVAKSK